jgi:hypothetical protein
MKSRLLFVFVFFLICEVGGLAIIHPQRGLTQIWLQVREESTQVEESCYIFWQTKLET